MPILNYTTQIDAYKTITEIQKLLSQNGASKIVMDNDISGNPISLTFCLNWNGNSVAFNLPCNFEGVLKSMRKTSKVPRKLCNEEQAVRVGWRILKDWIEAQMAIIQSQLATMPEVFLPYAVTKQGLTLYKQLEKNNQLFLTE